MIVMGDENGKTYFVIAQGTELTHDDSTVTRSSS